MLIKINGKDYNVNDDEFEKIEYKTYNNLRILNKLGTFERLISLFHELCNCLQSNKKKSIYFFNTTHGGFLPIETSTINSFDNIILINTKPEHSTNIFNNLLKFNKSNIISYQNNIKTLASQTEINNSVLLAEEIDNDLLEILSKNKNNILISNNNLNSLELFSNIYNLTNSNYYIYFNDMYKDKFNKVFEYFITENQLNYNNLLNVCIMVKNGGPQFEEMLIKNLPIMDQWTILDTGSTDDTINIINKVLVNKKKGNLYQEAFINFKESRNRLLDLAGESCKFNIILDDTYIVEGNCYEFLNNVRGDQYSTSFSLLIRSNDLMYNSNRIIKSASKLRYQFKIHETITDKNNLNVFIPEDECTIFDGRFEYMEKRTMERKENDLKLLFEELEEDPMNPRTHYYLGQTYNLLKNYEKAYEYFLKRIEFKNSGFIQERYDAVFEIARISNFQLNKSWEECLNYYNHCIQIDETRPEPFYYIGLHYYLEQNVKLAYDYFKKAFQLGLPLHCQYSLKPTLSYYFVPYYLTKICYLTDDYKLGEQAAELFLSKTLKNDINYLEIISWYNIYKKLNTYNGLKKIKNISKKPICCIVADGGFNPWWGMNIETTGVGGSETYIIEMAKYIQKSNKFLTYVFCNTPEEKEYIYEGTIYKPLKKYYEFVNTNYIHTCIVSRFSEYLPLTYKGYVDNVYFVVHDLLSSGIVIPIDKKLKNVFCLTEWHVEYFNNFFNSIDLKEITLPLYYGCNFVPNLTYIKNNFISSTSINFIYSSFPNRGLLELLKLWPKIYEIDTRCNLHIYCDVNNKWSNDVEPEKMTEIKNLLDKFINKFNIYYHGWVKKEELEKGWQQADIWFYPCTFMETFCLTALEAARTRTLAITNDLAGLQNTVGSRGVIIKGDATTEEWKDSALREIRYYLKNDEMRNKLIEENYNWSKNLTWENQANTLLYNYLLKDNLERKLLFNWTDDLPKGTKQDVLEIITYFNNNNPKCKIGEKINILEIGTYTGVSLISFISLINNSYGIGIDLWENNDENEIFKNTLELEIEKSFYNNIKIAKLEDRIKGYKQNSTDYLINSIKSNKMFDFIYIDGAHYISETYKDIILAWYVLEKNGIMIIGDYLYNKDMLESPFKAVNKFLEEYKDKYKLLNKSYRIIIEKL